MRISQGAFDLAIVIALEDEEKRPANESRVKVRIPRIHGPRYKSTLLKAIEAIKAEHPGIEVPDYYAEDDVLPWAQICYPLGTEPNKNIVKEGEMVYITFPSGDTDYPTIIGTTGTMCSEEEE